MKHPNPTIEALLQQVAHKRIPVIDLSLDRVHVLLSALGNPHYRLPPVVHVAGTNGKGSLLAFLKAMLEAAGYRVHRYTSPHLVRFNERIELAGNIISDDYLLSLLERIAPLCAEHPVTGFEATTALAFLAFAEHAADILLLETGMGGRLDATNVVEKPILTAITPISFDHMEFLGDSIAAIAAEKAGILKAGVPCVTGPQLPEALEVIEGHARAKAVPLERQGVDYRVYQQSEELCFAGAAGEVRYPMPAMPGTHQMQNAATAIACAAHLRGCKLSREHIAEGLLHAVWPARLQRLSSGALVDLLPAGWELWLDGGHNEGAAEQLAEWMQKQRSRVHVICGMMATKDAQAFLRPLAPYIETLCAVSIDEEPGCHSPRYLCDISTKIGIRHKLTENIKDSIELIVSNYKSGIILVCGSLYLAGNTLWQNNTRL